jgi:hypothetical protein
VPTIPTRWMGGREAAARWSDTPAFGARDNGAWRRHLLDLVMVAHGPCPHALFASATSAHARSTDPFKD